MSFVPVDWPVLVIYLKGRSSGCEGRGAEQTMPGASLWAPPFPFDSYFTMDYLDFLQASHLIPRNVGVVVAGSDREAFWCFLLTVYFQVLSGRGRLSRAHGSSAETHVFSRTRGPTTPSALSSWSLCGVDRSLAVRDRGAGGAIGRLQAEGAST